MTDTNRKSLSSKHAETVDTQKDSMTILERINGPSVCRENRGEAIDLPDTLIGNLDDFAKIILENATSIRDSIARIADRL